MKYVRVDSPYQVLKAHNIYVLFIDENNYKSLT